MASNLKVDIVKPTATNGSLSLKGDSGGSATANGISVDSSGNTSITGTTTTSTASLDGAVTINESGADVDFRIESDTVDHALFVQGSDGYVGIGVSSPADKLHVDGNIRLTSGSGINFSAYATSGNPSSNLLDDYEEGTFTVSVADASTGGNVSATTGSGSYKKIGSLVFIEFSIENINKSGLTSGNVVYFRDFPFAPANKVFNGVADTRNITHSGGLVASWMVGSEGNVGRLRQDDSNSGVTNVLVSDLSAGAADVYFTIVYTTT